MTMRNFADLPNVVLDTSDLDEGVFTPAWALDEKYKAVYPGVEIWHAVGAEAVAGGAEGKAEIQRLWKKGPEIWRELNFVVISRPGFRVSAADLPPKNEVVEIENFFGASTFIRTLLSTGRESEAQTALFPPVYEYVRERGLYKTT